MSWTDIAELGKSFGVAGAILAAIGFGGWRIMQRLMPKMETAFDRHNTLVETLSSAVNQIVLSIATLTQHAANHADKLDSLAEAVKKLHEKVSK